MFTGKLTLAGKPFGLIIMASILICFGGGSAAASGFILPRPPQDRPFDHDYRPLTVKSQHIEVDIRNQAARTTIEQVFSNHSGQVLEGTYIFPIPENASVSDFAMWMNGHKMEGELLDARQARRIYNDIVRRMKDPGLLEYAGRDMFRASVYPIPARGEVKIEIRYDQVLTRDSGLIGYRCPLNGGRFCQSEGEEVSLAVRISSDTPIKTLYSPSHDIDVVNSGRTASCGFEERDAVPDRDFILYYAVSDEELGLSLLSHHLRGEDGYFMLLLSPGEIIDPDRIIQKDVVFVIDKSGSMKGEKMEQARAALDYCINRLHSGDRFNIIAFSTGIEKFADEPVPAGRRAVSEAGRFIERLRAGGGTNINEALIESVRFGASRRPQQVVFLTDGLPTVGETQPDRILENVCASNRRDVRIFSFGVGYDVNTFLLDKLSEDNRGTVTYLRPGEDIEEKVSAFYDKVSSPVLSNIAIDFGGIRVKDVYPRQLPDIFSGSQLVLLGRYEDGGDADILLTGYVGEQKKTFVYPADFKRRDRGNGFLPRLWAARKIAYLLSELNLHGRSGELEDEIVFLAKKHGIVTPYTSYLVVEDEVAAGRPLDGMTRVRAPAPEPGRFEGTTGGRVTPGSPAEPLLAVKQLPDASSGREAADFSRTMAEEKERRVMMNSPVRDKIAYVGEKTFYLTDRGWIDQDFDEKMKVTESKYMSDSYIELMDRSPEIGKILALGTRVTFVFEGKAYRIVE
jgi:Ca-activated chloride channel family protein